MKSMGFLQVYLLYVSARVSTWNSVVRHICRSRITDPLPNYLLSGQLRIFNSWRVKFCTQGNTCVWYTDTHTERNITEIQYIYVQYMYIRHTDVRQKYLTDCVLCCITIFFCNLLDFPRLTIYGTKTAFLSLCENIAVYCILHMGYSKVRRKIFTACYLTIYSYKYSM